MYIVSPPKDILSVITLLWYGQSDSLQKRLFILNRLLLKFGDLNILKQCRTDHAFGAVQC